MAELGPMTTFALGYLAADQANRRTARTAVEVMNRLRQKRDEMSQDALIDALFAENDALCSELAILNDYIDRYKQWAEGEIARLERR